MLWNLDASFYEILGNNKVWEIDEKRKSIKETGFKVNTGFYIGILPKESTKIPLTGRSRWTKETPQEFIFWYVII